MLASAEVVPSSADTVVGKAEKTSLNRNLLL